MIDGLKTTTSLAGGVIVSAIVNDKGHLIITLSNGQQIDTGVARGPSGLPGTNGNAGEKGVQGVQGVTGAVGLKGDQGIQGPRGFDGQSFEIDRVGKADEKSQFNDEPAGFTFLEVAEDVVTIVDGKPVVTNNTKLHIKQTSGHDNWFPGVQFAKPVQGATGNDGPQGIQGIQGPTGAKGTGLEPDARGLTDARSIYDSEDPGFIFYDYQTNMFYVKLAHTHGKWSQPYSMMEGATGEKGATGDAGQGINIDDTIVETFDSYAALQFTDAPVGTHVASIKDDLLYVKKSVGSTLLNWHPGIRVRGATGPKGEGLRVDAPILNIVELQDYESRPMGFTIMHTESQTLFVKNYDYPVPGQDTSIDYSLPQYQGTTYKAEKQIWDGMSLAERRMFMWSSHSITQGDKGDQGEQGLQGDVGEQGLKGAQGTGFTPDFKGEGITPRKLYDNSVAGSSYLDTTYGMLYFRQTITSGQWGPAIPIAGGSGSAVGDIDFVSHSDIADPTNGAKTVEGHNVIRVTSVATGNENPTVSNIYLPGTSHTAITYLQVNEQASIVRFGTGISYGSIVRPEIWTNSQFKSDSSECSAVYELVIHSPAGESAHSVGSSDAFIADGMYEFPPFIVDSLTFNKLSPADTNIFIYFRVTFTGAPVVASDLNSGNMRFLIHVG